jgi:pimeloyl-ACP methyl ester carboxylesterase
MRNYARFLAKDGKALGEMIVQDVSKTTSESFFQSIGTLRQTDLRSQIGVLEMPVLGMYGKKDRIENPKQSKVLKECLPHAQIAWFEDAGHFIMMDSPDVFHDTLRDFLNNG